MRNFFQQLEYKMQQWMQGRYGYDELSKTLMIMGFVLMIASCIPQIRFLYIIAIAAILWASFRVYSKNIALRRDELYSYYKIKDNITSQLSLQKRKFKDRKTHKYFKCKKCGAVLRVPKGKGKIEILCPKCGNREIKKT